MLRDSLARLSNPRLIRQCVAADPPGDIATAAAYTLQLLARRILDLTKTHHAAALIASTQTPHRHHGEEAESSHTCVDGLMGRHDGQWGDTVSAG